VSGDWQKAVVEKTTLEVVQVNGSQAISQEVMRKITQHIHHTHAYAQVRRVEVRFDTGKLTFIFYFSFGRKFEIACDLPKGKLSEIIDPVFSTLPDQFVRNYNLTMRRNLTMILGGAGALTAAFGGAFWWWSSRLKHSNHLVVAPSSPITEEDRKKLAYQEMERIYHRLLEVGARLESVWKKRTTVLDGNVSGHSVKAILGYHGTKQGAEAVFSFAKEVIDHPDEWLLAWERLDNPLSEIAPKPADMQMMIELQRLSGAPSMDIIQPPYHPEVLHAVQEKLHISEDEILSAFLADYIHDHLTLSVEENIPPEALMS
jgi:hypothetical protein